MSEDNRPLRVFLCHSSDDKPTVRDLYRRMDAEGWVDAWLDEERLYPGQDWSYEIERAVETADVIIVCLTKNSVTKEGYVQRELKFALDIALEKPEGTIFIIPLRLDNCELPRRLRGWQYANYFPTDDRDQAYRRLLVSLRNRAKDLGLAQQKTESTQARPAFGTGKSTEDIRFSFGENTPMFREPKINSKVVSTLKVGERVEVLESVEVPELGTGKGWLKVRRKNGSIGWCLSTTLGSDRSLGGI